MFFLKKSSPVLKDIIPNDYTDIHSHLLPGIDDGSKSNEETILLISELKKIGFQNFITTPHIYHSVWNNTSSIIKNKNNEANLLLESKGISPIKAAAEYMIDEHFLSLIQNKDLLCLKDNHVLVEMSYFNAPIQLYDVLFELQLAGYKPILAHPERYNFYHNNFDEYKKLKKQGCLFQLNLLSTVGYYGSNVSKIADQLLKNNMIDFVGSDVHHIKHIKSFNMKLTIKNDNKLVLALKNNTHFTF